MDKLNNEIQSFKRMIDILDQCIDDYLYVLDVENDSYYISPHADIRFKMDKHEFNNPSEEFKKFFYYKDYDIVMEDLGRVLAGKKEFHNMQYRWLSKSGKPIWINCRGSVIYDNDHHVKYLVGCINENGKKQIADNASGLLGEVSFKNLIIPIQDDMHRGFVLRLGIDNFKNINENYGLKYGDEILKQTGKCIKEHLLNHQKLYRIVSDEFIILDLFGNKKDAKNLYNRICESIMSYVESINYEVYYTLSAGILDFEENPTASYTEIMKWTEFALSKAKKNGKNTYDIFRKEDYKEFQRKSELIKCLHQAVDHDFEGFDVYFQPIVEMNENRITSLEALLRFTCDTFGNVAPYEFIPLLEESDLIIPVGKWVLEKSIQSICSLKSFIPNLKVHVNVSYVQVLKTSILKDILNIINRYDIEKNQLVIELTESGFIESNKNFINFCNNLQKNDIQLALDDFGTGYSNFHYLYNLKPNCIKIDRGLMKNALTNDYENLLLKHMVDMSHSVGVKMCIEGVETESELQTLLQMKADYIQGYYYSKPCSLDELKYKLENHLIIKEA